jgi:Asp-tRNA(Asn)/Glu-tRNA(Gln) amidotransferase A subunit family amidase
MNDPFPGGQETLAAVGVTYQLQALGADLDDPRLSPTLTTMYTRHGRQLLAVDYVKAQVRRHELREHLTRLFDEYDVLCTPTLTSAAMRHDQDPWPEMGQHLFSGNHWTWFAYTYPFNFSGLPALSVPSARTPEGLPVGFQIAGPMGSDGLILELGAQLEEHAPWSDWPI